MFSSFLISLLSETLNPKCHYAHVFIHVSLLGLTQKSNKVTDSTATKTEKPGTITSDSLAAESLSSASGTFANNKATPSSQPSNSTTANNTDTSSATTLPPAKDAQARGNEEETSLSAEQAELDAGRPSNNSNLE
jgi:hypothetical protein